MSTATKTLGRHGIKETLRAGLEAKREGISNVEQGISNYEVGEDIFEFRLTIYDFGFRIEIGVSCRGIGADREVDNDGQERFQGQVKKYKLFSSKEKQIWAIRGKEIKAKRNNRKRPSLVQRKNGN